MKKLAFLIVLLSGCSSGQVPTISNITVWNGVTQQTPCTLGAGCTTDTNAVTIRYTTSPFSLYCWVQYGVASGAYLWSSYSYLSGGTSPNTLCEVPIGGLKDGMTYYFLPTARPNPDDEINICNVSACGAVEQSLTTPSSSVSHLPAVPNSVQANLLCEPDNPNCSSYSTPYVTVPLAATGTGGECVSTANVSAPSGYFGSISIGDTLTTIFAAPATKLWYGTVFEIPQGVTCIVPNIDGLGHGYMLLPMAVDPSATAHLITATNHRWIIFRTRQLNPSDFPPFGGRTGPGFFGHMGGFQQLGATPVGSLGTGGTIFTATQPGQFHHIWVENLKVSVNPTALADHDVFMMFGKGVGQPAPFPQYVVIRGTYFNSPSRTPSTSLLQPYVFGLTYGTMQPNMQWAMVGNYADNLSYGDFDGGYYQVGFTWTDCGFGGTCGYGGPALIDNNYIEGIGEPLYVEVNNHSNPTPYDFTVTHNDFYMTLAELAYAKALNAVGHYDTCGRAMVEFKGMTRGLISGNYINGQGACSNNGAPFLGINVVDYTATSNYITNSASVFTIVGDNTGSGGLQAFSSVSNRIALTNNIAFNLGFTNYFAGGGGMPIAFQMQSSPQNVFILNNTIGPIADDNTALGVAGYYDPFIAFFENMGAQAGFTMQSNVLPFGIGGEGSPFAGGINTQNLVNTMSLSPGVWSHPPSPANMGPGGGGATDFTSWLKTAAGYADGSAGAGMTATSTIAGGTGYSNGGSLTFGSGCSGTDGAYGVTNGGVIQSTGFTAFGVCTPNSGFTAAASGGTGASLRVHYGLTANYVWSGNAVACTTYAGTDMSDGQCTAYARTMPPTDIYTTGGSTAARYAAAGYANYVSSDWRCTPTLQTSCFTGINVNILESALGIVSHVSTQVSANSATVNYLAPDSRACSVDISPDGTTWTRQTDPGGSRQRSVLFTGLTARSAYQYRLLCYFDQGEGTSAGWFLFPSDPSNMLTDGTFTTLAGGPSNPAFAFSLDTFTGSTNFKVTMTAPDGLAQYSNTCTTSPCVVSAVPVGDYSTVRSWLSGLIVIASSDAQVVNVR